MPWRPSMERPAIYGRAIGDVLAEHGFDTTVIPPEAVGTIEDYEAIVLGKRGLYGSLA